MTVALLFPELYSKYGMYYWGLHLPVKIKHAEDLWDLERYLENHIENAEEVSNLFKEDIKNFLIERWHYEEAKYYE